MFLYSIEGSIPVDTTKDSDKQDVGRRICIELKRFDWEARVDGNVISFFNDKNVFSQMLRFDQSAQVVDSGEFVVGDKCVRYRLVTSYTLIFSVILVLPLVFCFVIQSVIGIACVVGYWLLTCVGNTLWITRRVRRALQRAAITTSSDPPR